MRQSLKVLSSSDALEPKQPVQQAVLSPELVMLSDPSGTTAEAIRQLRTRLIAQHLERGRRALALCSANKSSGCSFTAANLAVAFSQIGLRVLLVNGDMREQGADALFGVTGSRHGLLQQLADNKPGVDNLTAQQVLGNLWMVPSGGPFADAQEILSTATFETTFNKFVREFDLTIIDTPPANLYADAQRIAKVAAYAMIVARAHQTYYNDVVELTRQLQADRVTVVGTVLNQY